MKTNFILKIIEISTKTHEFQPKTRQQKTLVRKREKNQMKKIRAPSRQEKSE